MEPETAILWGSAAAIWLGIAIVIYWHIKDWLTDWAMALWKKYIGGKD